jgi:hypothetical protein
VDDDERVLVIIGKYLSSKGYVTETAETLSRVACKKHKL